MLTVEFIITEKCNLGCTYCYMNKVQTKMDPSKVDLFLESIGEVLKIYNQDKYHISFFGGEPLLNWDLIRYAVPKFKKDSRLHSIALISNGLEIDQGKAEYLRENGITLSLSFDGIWNDQNRPLLSGSPSFQEYIKKKDLLKSLVGTSKCMISPKNLETLLENHIFFTQDYGFTTPDFSLVRDDVWEDKDVQRYSIEIKKLADHIIARIKLGYMEFNGIFGLYILDLIYGKKFGKRNFGCFAGHNGVGYDSDGVYYPCARFASEKSSKIYNAVTKERYQEEIDYFLSDKISNPKTFSECIKCSLYNYCNGGCTHSQINYGGKTVSRPIPRVCDLLHLTYRESIRISVELRENKVFNQILSNLIKNVG